MTQESLCCGAAISEQFNICRECGEHAEPVADEEKDKYVNSLLRHEREVHQHYFINRVCECGTTLLNAVKETAERLAA